MGGGRPLTVDSGAVIDWAAPVEPVLLTNVRPMGGPALDLLVSGGRIAEAGAGLRAPAGATVVDGRGQLALPGLVDAHAHLDKTLWGLPWRPHSAGDGLAALIENEHRGRAELAEAGVTVAERAGNLLGAYVAAGTSHIRSHVDVDTTAGLDSLHGVLEARAAFADRISVELVAFPQSGLLVRPGTAELLEAAVQDGADLVGGLDPAGFDQRPVEHLDTIFAIADRHGRGLDIHLHDGGELGAFTLDLVVERTRVLGLAGKVTVSHAFALAEVPPPRRERLIEDLADQRISLTTVAPGNRQPLPLASLRAAGVRVGLGSDGVRDLWSPWGDGDLLARAALLAWRAGARRDEDLATSLDLATFGGAAVLDLPGYGLDPGCTADLVLVPAATLGEAVVTHPHRTLVLKAGRVL
jgi:cytosine/adenosine deaminase-related metal-dependent hydrolase